ncbi:MAG TPA: transglycosylase family protein [Egibacteraceae bacterium]|nr:transglycosylase family protein [Egibacteraceae bacterium]
MRERPDPTVSSSPRRHLVAVVILALLCSSISFAEPRDVPAEPVADTSRRAVDLPVTVPPRADRGHAPPPVEPSATPLGPVAVQQPRVRVDGTHEDALEAALGTDGVAFATAIALGEVAIREPGGAQTPVRVAVVDPAGFRVLTPQITADALDLWDRLAAGEVVFTHEHAQRLLLELGSHVPLGDEPSVRVGAFATHATPPVADAIVNGDTGERLGLAAAPRSLLVALEPDADPETVAEALERQLGAPAHVIADPRTPRRVDLDGLTTPENVWDRLALCESGGDWHINTGNGYYGGLQFLPESWFLVGGTGMPHEASREEQILRAEKLLSIQGWQAWPVCSILIGLRPGPLPERYRQGVDDSAPEPEPPAEPPGSPGEAPQPAEEPAEDHVPDEGSPPEEATSDEGTLAPAPAGLPPLP